MIGYFIERVAFMVGFAVIYRLIKKVGENTTVETPQRHLRLVSF